MDFRIVQPKPDVRLKLEKVGLVLKGNKILGKVSNPPKYKRPVPRWLGF